jgi:hypothetical protein
MDLPDDITDAKRKARAAQDRLIYERTMCPKPGPPRTPGQPTEKHTVITGSTKEELDTKLGTLATALGPRTRGNKRWGRTALYAELMEHFSKLEANGIRPPGNKRLSKKALSMGLGDILRRHGCTRLSDEALMACTAKRKFLGNKMSRVFGRVSMSLKKGPAKIA